jgi:hypothetical protein
MDGENEPPVLKQGETIPQHIKERWDSSALFRFPLNVIIPITSHSAFMNKMKQSFFNYRFSRRMNKNAKENYPARQEWSRKPTGSIKFADPAGDSERAIIAFYAELKKFDSLLTARNQLHSLYIQPHLAFRQVYRMNDVERALYNYYTATYNDPFNNTFKKMLYSGQQPLPQVVHVLDELHSLPQQVFVDYCHFTPGANEYIAQLIAEDILRGGNFN